MIGQPDPAGIFAGEHAGTGGGADRVGGIGVVKKDPRLPEHRGWGFRKKCYR